MGDIPESKDTDHDDVQLALDVAKSRLANGDHAEAIKWLRKAADTAFDVGDDRRGIELSKAAAELKPGGGVPGPSRPPPSPSVAPAPPIPGPAPAPLGGAKLSAPPSGLPKPLLKPTVPSASTMQAHPRVGRSNPPEKRPSKAPPVARISEPRPVKPKSVPPVDPSSTDLRRMDAKPPLPTRTTDEEDATREMQLSDQVLVKEPVHGQTAAVTGDEWPTESVSHVTEVADYTDRVQQADLINKAGVVTSAPPLHSQAFRVAVGRAEGGVASVRLLDEEGLLEGEHDAMLVSLDPGEDISELFK